MTPAGGGPPTLARQALVHLDRDGRAGTRDALGIGDAVGSSGCSPGGSAGHVTGCPTASDRRRPFDLGLGPTSPARVRSGTATEPHRPARAPGSVAASRDRGVNPSPRSALIVGQAGTPRRLVASA